MITKIKGNEYYLTRAQYEARKQAGTLVDGAEYHITDDKFIACYTTMPTPNVNILGQIVQYIGTTTANYTNGWFYKCVVNSGVYSWAAHNVQGGSAVWGGVGGDLEDQTDLYTALNAKEVSSNKVTSLSQSSTNDQYPSAKCVFESLSGTLVMLSINNLNWGSVTGGGFYPTGTPVTIVATPATDCYFLAWKDSNGNILSTNASYTFTPSSNVAITAMFNDQEHIDVVPWNDADISKVSGMIQAAYDGVIDLTDYWSCGDSRTTTTSAMTASGGSGETAWSVGETHAAQSIDLVLIDATCKGFKLASDGTTPPQFIVGMRDSLKETGYMNPTATNVGGWAGCNRRAWANYCFRSALPADIAALFKQFTWSTYGGSGASPVLTSCNDYFALTPEKAIFGSGATRAKAEESALYDQWEWYQTAANRIKKVNGSASDWWEASAYSGNATNFCSVFTDGSAHNHYAYNSYGLSVFGCI